MSVPPAAGARLTRPRRGSLALRMALLATSAELGLVTFPQAPAGMTNGDLR